MDTHYDPATRRYYTVDETTGQSRWIEPPPPPRPVQPPVAAWTQPTASRPQRRVSRRSLWIAGIGFLAVMGIIGAVNGGGDSSGPSAQTTTVPAAAPATSTLQRTVVPALAWIRTNFDGADWLDEITSVKQVGSSIWIYTKLFQKDSNKQIAEPICSAGTGWRLDQHPAGIDHVVVISSNGVGMLASCG